MLKNKLKRSLFFRKQKIKKKRSKVLQSCPQVKADCIRVFKMSPKKPNSANRSVARVRLSNGRRLTISIPGIGHNLQKHSTVLVRGGRSPDLPGVNLTAICGKFDLKIQNLRRTSRSKYGGSKL
jgi:small subunit ribosomal protein S12